jgi:hypothetical protein
VLSYANRHAFKKQKRTGRLDSSNLRVVPVGGRIKEYAGNTMYSRMKMEK